MTDAHKIRTHVRVFCKSGCHMIEMFAAYPGPQHVDDAIRYFLQAIEPTFKPFKNPALIFVYHANLIYTVIGEAFLHFNVKYTV